MTEADDRKYVTFKREQFNEQLVLLTGTESSLEEFEQLELADAVVIRRQDVFASPALAMYAASIATAIKLNNDPAVKATLLTIADYFQRQSEIAGDEGWKFPTL